MNNQVPTIAQQITEAISVFHEQSTGHQPKAVTDALCHDTLDEASTVVEKTLAKTAEGATQVQEFHRQLFAASSHALIEEIKRITGSMVREATAELEPTTRAIVHAFTAGDVVQVFLPSADGSGEVTNNNRS